MGQRAAVDGPERLQRAEQGRGAHRPVALRAVRVKVRVKIRVKVRVKVRVKIRVRGSEPALQALVRREAPQSTASR